MPRPPESHPKSWAGLQLPLGHEFFDRLIIDGIASKIDKNLDVEIEAQMPGPDGAHRKSRVTVGAFLAQRLNRLAQVYVWEQSESLMPTPKQNVAQLESIKSNLSGLINALGMTVLEGEQQRIAPEFNDGEAYIEQVTEINLPPAIRQALEPYIKAAAYADAAPEIMTDAAHHDIAEIDIKGGALRRILSSLHILDRAVVTAMGDSVGNARIQDDPINLLIKRLGELYQVAFGERATRRTDYNDGMAYSPFLDFAEAVCDRIDSVIGDSIRDGSTAIAAPLINLSHDAIGSRIRRQQDNAKSKG